MAELLRPTGHNAPLRTVGPLSHSGVSHLPAFLRLLTSACAVLVFLMWSLASPAMGQVYQGMVASVGSGTAVLMPQSSGSGMFDFQVDGASVLSSDAYFTLTSVAQNTTVVLTCDYVQKTSTWYVQNLTIPSVQARVSLAYVTRKNYVEINVTVQSTQKVIGGFKLALHLPLSNAGWRWQPGPTSSIDFTSTLKDPPDAQVYPLTAIINDSVGFALAIPPNWPAVFSFYRSSGELVLEFPLGTSPTTKPYNCSVVHMQLWSIKPRWGFRQALQDYYDRFPTFFTRRCKAAGLWSTAQPGGVKASSLFLFHEHGNIFFSDKDSSAKPIDQQCGIDATFGWMTFPYTIVGQMSRVRLNSLPSAQADIDTFLAGQPEYYPPLHIRQFSDLGLTPQDYRNTLMASRTLDASQKPNVLVRTVYTDALDPATGAVIRQWDTMGKMVSFAVDPDPALSVNGVKGIGYQMLRWADMVSQEYNIAGIYVDSLGYSWARYKDYRIDHFATTTCRLAVDSNGVVYLPNSWGHYEFLESLSSLMHSRGKLVFGNGGSFQGDRFFIGTLLDIIGQEVSVNSFLDRNTYATRCVAGPKPAVRLAVGIGSDNPDTVRQYVNTSLAFGLLPSTWGSYFAGPNWVNYCESFATCYGGNPNYSRDAALWSKVSLAAQTIGISSWKPVTLATTPTTGVLLERFSYNSTTNYLTVLSTGSISSAQVVLDPGAFQNPVVLNILTQQVIPTSLVNGSITFTVPLSQESDALDIIEIIDSP